jgi:hypothetical protein
MTEGSEHSIADDVSKINVNAVFGQRIIYIINLLLLYIKTTFTLILETSSARTMVYLAKPSYYLRVY